LGKPSSVNRSRFIPIVKEETCVSCSVCQERCPAGAIKVTDGPAEVTLDRCIGCGLCASGCPSEAISLEERKDYQEPFPTLNDLFVTFLQEKGEALGEHE
jgi:Na+-translocating ferredoxin:NAD+ oxidoreductase subunit B